MNKETIPVIYKSREAISLRLMLGPFNYEPSPEPDGVKVSKHPRKEMVAGKTKFNEKGTSGWEYEGEINLEG